MVADGEFTGDASGQARPTPAPPGAPDVAVEVALETPDPEAVGDGAPAARPPAGHFPLRLGRRAAIPSAVACAVVGVVLSVRFLAGPGADEAGAAGLEPPRIERGLQAVVMVRPTSAESSVPGVRSGAGGRVARRLQVEAASRRLVLVQVVRGDAPDARGGPRAGVGDVVAVTGHGRPVSFEITAITPRAVTLVAREAEVVFQTVLAPR